MTNSFKGLDLIDRVPEELWTEVCNIVQEAVNIVQEAVIKTIPKKKKCKKAKYLSEEALHIAVKRRQVKSKGEKERYTHLNAEFQRIARRDKKALLSNQCKEIEENSGMRKTRDLFKKKKCKKAKWLSEEALQIAVKRRELKSKGEKERYTHSNAEFQRIARRD